MDTDPFADTPDYVDLPAYPTRTEGTETVHRFDLQDNKGSTWLTLKVSDWRGGNAKVPRLVGSNPLVGSVTLDLKEETTIKQISVVIFGEMIRSVAQRFTFVRIEQTLWNPQLGQPREAGAETTSEPASPGAGQQPSEYKGKLRGTFTFPFSLSLPPTVTISDHGPKETYSIPSTFKDRAASVNYKLDVKVTRGRFSAEHLVGTNVIFTPFVKPEPTSLLRTIAYLQGTPLLGPSEDPHGWHTHPPTLIRGKLFGSRDVELRYTLSLAKPLAYTRGASIPVSLAVQCPDAQALNLLSAPTAPILRLLRVLSLKYDSTSAARRRDHAFFQLMSAEAKLKNVPMRDRIDEAGVAAWWPETAPVHTISGHGNAGEDVRVLQGEVHLTSTPTVCLYPSAHLGRYKLSYHIALYPPTGIAGFVSDGEPSVPIEVCDVEIATIFPDGPKPRTYSVPVELSDSERASGTRKAALRAANANI